MNNLTDVACKVSALYQLTDGRSFEHLRHTT